MFRVLPRGLSSSAHVPGGDHILQVRDRWERIARKADIQRALGRFNETVQSGVECRIVFIVCSTMIRSGAGELTGSGDGFRKVVIDVGINAGQRELDTRDRGLLAGIKQHLPACGRCLTEE